LPGIAERVAGISESVPGLKRRLNDISQIVFSQPETLPELLKSLPGILPAVQAWVSISQNPKMIS
jgi:hypothetical protein